MGNRRGNSVRLFFLGSKITADGDCSHEIKRRLLLGRKVMTNLHITLPTKVRLIKAMVFPVVMYECERWTIKKVECWRIDAFELWCWRRLLRVSWTARRSNQSILKEISPEYSALMLKLKLQYFGHLVQRIESLEKTWMLGKTEKAMATHSSTLAWKIPWTEEPGRLSSMGSQRVGQNWATSLSLSLLSIAICKTSSYNHFAFLHFVFLGMVLITASCTITRTSIHSSSGTLSIRSNPLNLFVSFTV